MTTVATPRPPTSPARSHRAGLFHAQTILNRNVASMCKINDAQQHVHRPGRAPITNYGIQKAFRMSKHDLAARPIYHHNRGSMTAIRIAGLPATALCSSR